ncbi:MAG TPA: hypothetical protein ACFYD4_11985 [Candidatus Wunengus sp. YC61]|uniref:hypothetical protein n=1 Tax=Candidatus Wunengus sp. YC61 TaxID=3367698 RepID=UPI0040283CE3
MTAILGSGLAFFMISGCAIKHSDVMLFGTNTKYGLSIAADVPENTPHINVGYKRQEFVWMPLVANGADTVIQNKVTNASAQDLKYTGKEPVGKEDTYSVLASFGANFKAGGGSAGGGIAQYFATGMAARKLAEVGGASLVQASDKDLTPMSMLRDITPEERMEVLTEIRKRNNHISEIVNYVKTSEGKIDFEKLKKLNEGPAIRENWENDFKDKEIKALEDYLKNTSEAAETLYKNYEKNK